MFLSLHVPGMGKYHSITVRLHETLVLALKLLCELIRPTRVTLETMRGPPLRFTSGEYLRQTVIHHCNE